MSCTFCQKQMCTEQAFFTKPLLDGMQPIPSQGFSHLTHFCILWHVESKYKMAAWSKCKCKKKTWGFKMCACFAL